MKVVPLILPLIIFSFLAFAESKWPKSVDEYEKLLATARANKDVGLEIAYKKGLEAINLLAGDLGKDESDIDPGWLKTVRKKMEGFDINPNTETYVANTEPNFFLTLAQKNKNAKDIEFFELLSRTEPDGRWPIFLEQEADLEGCTKYDGTLSKLYDDWMKFQLKHPKDYMFKTKSILSEIETNLSESNCSCTKEATPILKELEDFIKSHRQLAITAKIQKRIKDITNKKAPIPGCKDMG